MEADPKPKWLDVVKGFLERAKEIEGHGSQEEEIRSLCRSIRSLFGEKTFQDYYPTFDQDPAPAYVKQYSQLADKIYELAEEIRTIGSY
jgi:hypothetical protein